MSDKSLGRARAVKGRALTLFQPYAEVMGVGITKIGGVYGVKVNLRDEPAAGVSLPESIDGVPIKIEVIGTVEKRTEPT